MMHRFFCSFAAFALLWPPICMPMQIHFKSLDEVLEETQLAVIADILSTADHRESEMWRVRTMKAEVVKTIFGGNIKNPVLQCVYEEGLPHLRGTLAVSPLVTGSGNEFGVKPGERVVLLIEHALSESKTCNVLRIEPLSNEGLIKGRKARE